MLRCVLLATAFCLAIAAPLSACAQARTFPANAWRGDLIVAQPPAALLNGVAVQLAPGARIRSGDNLLLMSGALVGQRYLVHYTLDPTGLLLHVWLLTAEEAARQPWPRNAQEAALLRFDPATQTWSRP